MLSWPKPAPLLHNDAKFQYCSHILKAATRYPSIDAPRNIESSSLNAPPVLSCSLIAIASAVVVDVVVVDVDVPELAPAAVDAAWPALAAPIDGDAIGASARGRDEPLAAANAASVIE